MNMSTKNHKLKVGLDFDGVIVDHTKNKILVAQRYGFSIAPYQIVGRRLKKLVPETVYRQIQNDVYGQLTLAAPIMKDANQVIKCLSNTIELFLVSRRQSPLFRLMAKKWLINNLPKIFSVKNTIFVDTNRDKSAVCRQRGINVFLDDHSSVLERLDSVPHRYWFDQYDSSDELDCQGLIAVKSWKDFLVKVKRLSIAQPSDR